MLKIQDLKNNFSQYRPFFTFLLKFLLFYVVFTFVYKMYLNQYDIAKNEVDSFTEAVANQTEKLMGVFVENTKSFRHDLRIPDTIMPDVWKNLQQQQQN